MLNQMQLCPVHLTAPPVNFCQLPSTVFVHLAGTQLFLLSPLLAQTLVACPLGFGVPITNLQAPLYPWH